MEFIEFDKSNKIELIYIPVPGPTIRELIDRPIIRTDQVLEYENKMTDAELRDYKDYLYAKYLNDGDITNALTFSIDRDILYHLFKMADPETFS